MTRCLAPLLVSVAAALVAGCATPSYYSPVEVTRFAASEQPSARVGPIGLRAAPGEDAGSSEYAAFQAAVRDQMAEQGFQIAGDNAPYVALINVERYVVARDGRRSPVSVGGGGSVGSFGSGVGLGVGIDLSGRRADEIITELSVNIRPSAGGTAIWEGRARFTATDNSDYADLTRAAQRMARALFSDYPGNSGETVEIR